jgi:hypothetical protein
MSSRATPKLIEERRRTAEREYPRTLNRLTDNFIASVQMYDPSYQPDPEERERLRMGFDARIGQAAGTE